MKPPKAQTGEARSGEAVKACTARLSADLYHEVKMLACKGIFTKPPKAQTGEARNGEAVKACTARLSADF